MITGVLIDPVLKEVSPIEVRSGNLDDIYAAIGADCFDAAYLSDGTVVYVDDEGLMKPNAFFLHEPSGRFLAGRALALGTDDQGNSISCPTSIDDLKSQIDFGDPLKIGSMLMFVGDRVVREIR